MNSHVIVSEYISKSNHIYNIEAAKGDPQELFFAAFEFAEDILKNNLNIFATNSNLNSLKSRVESEIIYRMKEFDYPLTSPYVEAIFNFDKYSHKLDIKFALWINGKRFQNYEY
jgi:hypothetical protein